MHFVLFWDQARFISIMEMNNSSADDLPIFNQLEKAPYGAYAIDLNQRIIFWNSQAERLLGFDAAEVMGRKCYDVVQGLSSDGTTPLCAQNCPAVIAARHGHIPPVSHVRMKTATGAEKLVNVFPLIATDQSDQPVLIHMFHETVRDGSARSEPEPLPLTPRETEVLGLLASGLRPAEIADRLFVSVHTVRTHISNASDKLHSRGMMSAVLAAQRHHLI